MSGGHSSWVRRYPPQQAASAWSLPRRTESMHPTVRAFEDFAEKFASGVVPGATAAAALAASAITFAAAIRWFRNRRGSTRARERLFVGRWGDFGPELYLVGKRVRRLVGPEEHKRRGPRGHPPPTALAFARRMLAEVMHCSPATPLARGFADAQLEPLPPDGFVLSTSDVEAWLDTRQRRFESAERGDSPRAA
jgi:hypothetical protein